MQKVSKQSLAMLALSILLAISIALTFTFAALKDTKEATGTITFSGTASITMSGDNIGTPTTSGVTTAYEFKLVNDDFNFEIVDGKTKATLNKDLSVYKIAFTNTATTELTWTITASSNDASIVVNTNSDVTGTLKKGSGDASSDTVTKTFADIITSIVIADADAFTNGSILITATIGA